jgi:NAD(P)-dependent dehydrogenase (short-subunit alcohol dehydrogenase family)
MKNNRVQKWYDLNNRVVVLTGATGRLGQYYADLLAEQGANLALIDLDKSKVENLANELIEKHKIKALGISVDISNKNQLKEAFSKIVTNLNTIDILINNAAAVQTTVIDGNIHEFEEFPLEVWQSNLDVNLTGSFLCCQFAGKQMLKQKKGVILNIGSVYGVVGCDQRIYGDSGINSSIAYATTKSGLLNFTRYLASYWQGKNIRVNCLSPGGVSNDSHTQEFLDNYHYRTMMKRMANKDDLGAALLYLVSDASDWVTGTDMAVDGGWTAW